MYTDYAIEYCTHSWYHVRLRSVSFASAHLTLAVADPHDRLVQTVAGQTFRSPVSLPHTRAIAPCRRRWAHSRSPVPFALHRAARGSQARVVRCDNFCKSFITLFAAPQWYIVTMSMPSTSPPIQSSMSEPSMLRSICTSSENESPSVKFASYMFPLHLITPMSSLQIYRRPFSQSLGPVSMFAVLPI